jgi:hypothetical protein
MMRRTYRKSQVTVSLFPFLAVLICMMGALIVLLVLVVQQARVSAAVATDDGPTAEQLAEADELELARQDHQWRREILDQQRLEMTKQQANHRLELSHLEDHIRRLEEKWKLLQADAAILTTSAEADNRSVQSAAAELVQLRQAIGLAQQQLHEAREAAETRPRSYAIIPYRGMHGTLRRPIFIECTARGIVLQPEGLVITESDLNGPAGPGNPLDAALRATREYLVANGIVDLEGEPYPLLIVRPDGTEAYGAARNAMKTWDDEFGYELVEADVQLEYPTADPVLRELIIKTIADARQRQEILAAAMPSRFGGLLGGGGGGRGVGWGGLVATHGGGFAPTHQVSRHRGQPGSTRTSRTGQSGGSGGDSQEDSASRHSEDGHSPNRAQQGDSETGRGPGGPDNQGNGANQGSPAGPQAGGTRGAQNGGSTMGGGRRRSRGGNWALPKASRNATGVTRPVRVACWSDRLLILPDRGEQRKARTILIDNNLNDQIDVFVSEIWKHTDGWGLALIGGYWKPVVNVEVAPGGEDLFLELERLMEGSGLEVKRKAW